LDTLRRMNSYRLEHHNFGEDVEDDIEDDEEDEDDGLDDEDALDEESM